MWTSFIHFQLHNLFKPFLINFYNLLKIFIIANFRSQIQAREETKGSSDYDLKYWITNHHGQNEEKWEDKTWKSFEESAKRFGDDKRIRECGKYKVVGYNIKKMTDKVPTDKLKEIILNHIQQPDDWITEWDRLVNRLNNMRLQEEMSSIPNFCEAINSGEGSWKLDKNILPSIEEMLLSRK